MSKLLLLPLFCFVALVSFAQSGFKYRASVQKIDSAGFYKISLLPSIVAKSNEGLTDLRLTDAKGHYIPYVDAANMPVKPQQSFVVFPQVKVLLQTDSGTSMVVENKAQQPISRIWIRLKSTAVIRTMSISGSDDLNRWFAIEEGVPLEQADLNNSATYIQSLSFPASNYHYLKILVNDKNKTPIKFMEAGVYTSSVLINDYQAILPVSVTQADSGSTSYITIKLNDKYLINKVHLNISGPKYFKRQVAVYDDGGKYPELISESELNSAANPTLLLSAKTDKLLLKINNEDNLPLIVKGAQLYQTDQYIVSYLEAGQPYYLLTGNTKANAPSYDLKFFTDSIHGIISGISHAAVIDNPAYLKPVIKQVHNNTAIIWGAIIIAVILLLFLTLKMTKEMNNKNTAA
ncbi:hypothetical protein [Mucilaginibacter sp.]|uniref:hypothetical protein n=1 Tax=Mucilaginibacter sp. TaxID=1882438 RepID=UPI003D14885F